MDAKFYQSPGGSTSKAKMEEVSFQTAFESVMSGDNLFHAIHAYVYILVNTAISEYLTPCAVNDSLHLHGYVG